MGPTLLSGSNSTPRKPLFKRRRLASLDDRPTLTPAAPDIASQAHADHLKKLLSENGGRLVCSSCQRALSARPEAVVICARCLSATCPICTRTCTAPPQSYPPTPDLTYSPTPAPSPTSNYKRTALGSTPINIVPIFSTLGYFPGATKKRKEDDKSRDRDEDFGEDDAARKGCNRLICKGCCEESWQSGLSTCLDCYPHM
ncbi:hypothetical protein FIBSPDRAFT_836521 [Athelia psychrophila]|uniref:Uncharacterized protein n=1 Tax=Athelia psychrophila TaxID=1759441 RepID=A0A166B2F3_9AGAM|nr:hypothetical protein FIBSPDRAFT_836521 [Fibularhizoctonia sp. CBS 109695]